MNATNTKQSRMLTRDRDNIRSSQPAPQVVKQSRLPRLTRISEDYVSATLGNKSGFATYSLDVGDATYRAITWAVVSSAEIAGVTTQIAGKHYILNDHLSAYLDTVRVVANGGTMEEYSMYELNVFNNFMRNDFGPVFTGFAYPGDNTYTNEGMTDAFALGTANFRSLSLELRMKAAFDPDTMEVTVMPWVIDKPANAGFTFTTERLNQTFNASGKHTYSDLPVGDDISGIWLRGNGIRHLKLEVDGDVLFDMDRAAYESYLWEKGLDPFALQGEWYLDIHAEGIPRSIAALDRQQERRRDARVKMVLTTSLAETPVEFLVRHADLYHKIR